MSNLLTIILAAGQGTRMKSNLTKVLHKVCGRPLIEHVISNVQDFSSKTIVVVGYQDKEVKECIKKYEVELVEQKEQLGTGHAVLQTREFIEKHDGPVLILYGDTPLLKLGTLQKLVIEQSNSQVGAVILTACVENPFSYGRIIRQGNEVIKIIEEKDANQEQKAVKEINSGVYCFNSTLLAEALSVLDNNNSQKEYYLTDTISYISSKAKVIPFVVEDNEEIIGINDRVNLAKAEKVLRRRINNFHMMNGVTIIDPQTTYIDREVEIGIDTVVYPFTYLEGRTKIGSKTIIGPYCKIVNGEIGNDVNLNSNCVILDSKIDDETNIGPFVYIRPGSRVSKGAKVGDFVELKKAIIGQNTKVPHLSYVGDAEIGEGTNIGAGTIFANYDGKDKHKTIIGNSAFIGSNTTLIAPVKVGNNGKTGAGAVVTKDVPENELVVGVPARIMRKKTGGRNN